MREKKHFILILTLSAIRLFAQPALPVTNQTFSPIANAYSGSWIYYTTNPASGLGFLNGASIPYVMATSNDIVTYINAATNGFVTSTITNGLAAISYVNFGTNFVSTNGLAQLNNASNVLSGQINAANSLTLTIGNNATNYANTVGLGATNLALRIGADDTNFAYMIGANATNYANQVGLNTTNYIKAAIIADTNFPVGLNADNINVTNTLSAGTVEVSGGHGLSMWAGTSFGTVSAGATHYCTPNNTTSASMNGADANGSTRIPMTRTLTLKNLYVLVSGGVYSHTSYNSKHTATLTIMTNGVASPISVTFSGSTTAANDTTGGVTVPAGTPIGIKITTGSSTTAVDWSWSFEGE